MGFEIGSTFLFFSDENKMPFALKEIVYETDDYDEIREREEAIMLLTSGVDLYKKGKFKKAFKLLEKALSIFKLYSELSYGIGLFFVGEYYEFKEEWQNALKNYQLSYDILEKYQHRMVWDARKKIEKIKKRIDDENNSF